MIGRAHHVASDCVDPLGLARFSSAPLGLPVTFVSHDWVVVVASQQVHLDVMTDDLDAADADPAGHPFCLVSRASSAPSIGSTDPSPPSP